MGKIKEYLYNMYEDILEFIEYNEGSTVDEIDDYMRTEGTSDENEFNFYLSHKDIILDMIANEVGPLPESLKEASRLKRGAHTPWRGRNNDAGISVDSEDLYDDETINHSERPPHRPSHREFGVEWPKEMRDEENWDEDDDVPYPGGLTQDDYDYDYDDNEYMMESIGDFLKRVNM